MNSVNVKIEGMSCGGCVKRVREAIEKAGADVTSAVQVGEARIVFDGAKKTAEEFAKAIEKLGFDAHVEGEAVAL